MTKRIFRVPVDTKHFEDTIVKGKTYDQLLPFLNQEERNGLEVISAVSDGVLRYWGSLPGSNNLRTFKQIEKGDEILFYRGGKYIAVAFIGYVTINPELARYSWPDDNRDDTWELMYFFSSVALLSVEAKVLNSEWGFKDGPVMGFSKLSDEKAQPFFQKYGSVAHFLSDQKVAA